MIENKLVCGIDIGGTNTTAGLVTPSGEIVLRKNMPTVGLDTAEEFIDAVSAMVLSMVSETGCVLKGIGIGAPNGNFYNGTIEFAPNLPWKGVIHFADLIKKHFPDAEVLLTNDANAAAWGERIYGAAKGENDFIMITLGTGVGSGIVANGNLIYGHDGFAGEIGHTIVDPYGRQCGCGRKGCLETYTSASGIVKTALKLIAENGQNSVLSKIPKDQLSSKTIAEAALQGDHIAVEVFDKTAWHLGLKLADAVAHTSPSSIYIFGGVAKAGDLLMLPLKKYFNEFLLQIYKNKVALKWSALPGNDAAILGAASLVQ
ncbi:MAG: glucokinase [Bacteroidetes bacterium GWF2_43_63]|nr:MAG: glucokinase [Bacteroidetes bacterium GWE2_42_42]OFY52595.1 MAG: glucokinase [Bacteroidetes bacterium GWF2_43_63]HBG71505.1 glucokinase [Bacteroidales bacterium]HCB60743.1 glucokinase [Bacteroidales bacterium]HCY23532.1 glucokinase [Bacteroidales bacterium]